MNFPAVKEFIVKYLRENLPQNLPYHGIHHTLGVCLDAQEIALHEDVQGEELYLLLSAALFHDSGFTQTYQGHEAVSIEIARQHLPSYGYSPAQIDRIAEMIMATRIPQSPKEHLGEILCDADLYYLGGKDFYPIGRTLFHEFCDQGIVCDEKGWNEIQLKFLSNHEFFTQTARKRRRPTKERYLHEIQELVSSYAA